ncbi:hypothetical protein [Methylobacillus glycogenes]|uniref:hypothetical protein n=1 Tax=Methylobacillus glycogenes TaxID=406 RepID=UPI00046ED185|nr:hypothetical protein [Methylobacillus glycogenes]
MTLSPQTLINIFIVVGLISALLIILVIPWVTNRHRTQQETEKIYNWLKKSKQTTRYKYRSSISIAINCELSESRVNHLCSQDARFSRAGETGSFWGLSNEH